MRSRSAAVAILAALFVACLPPADAGAQASKKKTAVKAAPVKAGPGWRFVRRLGMPTLEYGANAGDFQLSLSCQPDTGLMRVIAQIGSRGLQPGDDAAIRLANGKNRFEVAGTAFSTAMSRVDVGGATRFNPDLFVLFKEGETLVVEVPGRRRSLPIADAGRSAGAFLKACTATAAARQAPAG